MIPGYYSRRLAGCSGPPRWLLLHGFTGSHADWLDAWPETLPALALDLPGHGQSPDPEADFVQETARLLAALPPSIDRIAGYSLGGRVALSLMAAAPERFGALLIVSAHPGLTDAKEREPRCQQDQHWINMLRNHGIKRFAAAWQRQALFQAQHLRAPQAVARQHRHRLAQRPEGLAQALACFGLGRMPATWDALRAYQGRLHWLSGALDEKFRRLGERVRTLRPATTHHIIPDCGHNPLLEMPNELKVRLEAVEKARA